MPTLSLRALPRVFLPGADPTQTIALPPAEIDKFRKTLRLRAGDQIAVLPNDGSVVRCSFQMHTAEPIAIEWPDTEPQLEVTLLQALPKGDRVETVVRMGTELGVRRFVLFHAARSVARWEPKKLAEKLRRLEVIAREAAEQSFRTRLPEIAWTDSLKTAFVEYPSALPLSEREGTTRRLAEALGESRSSGKVALAIGPEGGWDPGEMKLIGDRGVTMGPLVLRTDTAGLAAAAVALLGT